MERLCNSPKDPSWIGSEQDAYPGKSGSRAHAFIHRTHLQPGRGPPPPAVCDLWWVSKRREGPGAILVLMRKKAEWPEDG